MRHANGNWVWLRARCELVQQPGEVSPHLIGIAVDITEQKTLVEKTVEADLRLRDAIETIPEAFVLWDAEQPHGAVQLQLPGAAQPARRGGQGRHAL